MTGTPGSAWSVVDPFDLPDWLGTSPVTWSSTTGLGAGHLVTGELSGEPMVAGTRVACDLLAVDEAYPTPVADAELRRSAHQAWRRGEVSLVARGGRLALAAPGTRFDADRAIEAVRRLARAVGAAPSAYAVLLRVG